MKMLWTKIWISGATVLIALLTGLLIIVLHLAKAVQFIFSVVVGKKRAERHT